MVAGASLFSSILGNDAYADASVEKEIVANSQNIALLTANVSSVSVLESKESKQSGQNRQTDKQKDEKNAAPSEVEGVLAGNIVSDNALLPNASPMLAATGGVDVGGADPDDISVYVIRKGDSISQIAEMFGVSVNTILWANDLKKGAKLEEGDTLLILPISGVQHTVAKGETLQSLAKRYQVDVLTITSFNGLAPDAKLAVGDELIIPDAEMPNDDVSDAPKKSKGKSVVSKLKAIAGYFINPVPELKRKSQGLHGPGNRGVDLAAPTGTRILASAGGTVILARNGWNGGYGNMVTVQHANGTKTLYAHMSKITTKTGAKVGQGEVIGYVGSTGRSTGPHLHFEVFNAKNPGADWTWAR